MVKVKRNTDIVLGKGTIHKEAFDEQSSIVAYASFQIAIETAIGVEVMHTIPEIFNDSSVVLVEVRNANGNWVISTHASGFVKGNKLTIRLIDSTFRYYHFRFTLMKPKLRTFL